MSQTLPAPHVTKHRLAFLDCIRALCAFGVIYLHAAFYWRPHSRPAEAAFFYFISLVIDVGKIGVVSFFMVSGFIIPVSLKANKPIGQGIRNFLISRVFRLYPAYWLSLVAAFYFVFHWSLAECSLKRILFNITMFQSFLGVRNMNGLFWTLQIEWIFYILCMALYIFRSLDKPKRILGTYFFFLAVSFLFAIVRFKTHKAIPLAAPLALCVMFASTLWRMVALDGRAEIRPYVRWAFGSFLVSIPVISLLAYNFDTGFEESWYRYTLDYWIAIGFFLLFTSKIKITWRPLALVGQASYSLYLFNDFVQMVLLKKWLDPVVGPISRLSPNLYLIFSIVVGSLFSIALYNYLEKPMVAVGRKVTKWLDSAEAKAELARPAVAEVRS